jgi:iron complex outermembrane receptor protein
MMGIDRPSWVKQEAHRRLLSAVILILLGMTQGIAQAENIRERKDNRIMEEIVVTARKRAEPLQEVPISAKAFTEFDIQELGIRDLADIQYQTPNLTITPFPAVSADASISMRGQSQFEPVITLDPAVGIYMDGVYMGRATAALLNLVDLERVEVLMGPQGTLYGRNTTGGVINLISAKSRSDTTEGFLDFVGGSFSGRNLTGAYNLPIIYNKLSARVSFRSANRDGYGRNTLLGEDLDDESANSWRVNINWQPTEDINVLFSYDATRQREYSQLFHVKEINPAVLDPACLTDPDPLLGCFINFVITEDRWTEVFDGDERKVRSDVSSRHDVDVNGASLTLDIDVGDFAVRSISAYRELSRRNINDIDGTEFTILHPDADASQDQFSQELQIFGETQNLEWIGGIFYFEEEGDDNTSVVAVPELNPGSPSRIFPHGENSSAAIFGHTTYQLTERTGVTAGLRYTREERELRESQYTALGCSLEFVNRPPCTTVVSETFSGWSYTLGVDFQWTDNWMFYASINRGFKSGGFNARASKEIEFEPFDPEIVLDLELGFKSSFDWARVDLGLFYSDYSDIQRAQLVALSPTDIASTVQNVASAYVTGGELQISAAPHPLLEIYANFGLIIAEYKKFTDVDSSGNIIDKSSLKFPQTPKYNFSTRVRYTFAPEVIALDGELSLQLDYAWQSKVYHDVDNSDIAQDAVGILNFRTSYLFPGQQLELAFFIKNLTDEVVATGGLDFLEQFGYSGVFLGPPRTYNAQISWYFGG